MKVIHSFMSVATLLSMAGCSLWDSNSKVVFPATPPLSAETLEQTATSCPKEIERLKSRKAYVPEERQKEYKAVVNLAENYCDEMVETLQRLKSATYQEQSYRQNLQHAEAAMVAGAVPANESSPPTEAFDQPAQQPADQGEIFSEPLK